jgi:hypothetical protein
MLSNKSLYEIVRIIDKMKTSEIQRIISVFNFTPTPIFEKVDMKKLGTGIFNDLRYKTSEKEGPFTSNLHLDLLQFIIDDFFSNGTVEGDKYFNYPGPWLSVKNAFSITNPLLANSLKRDGYIVEGAIIKKLLPEEIQEAKLESELANYLSEFGFTRSKQHLAQAIHNHNESNWAAANAQFRAFVESLLTEICSELLPMNEGTTFAAAVNLLADTCQPPFLSRALKEISDKKSDAFVNGLWARLHAEGSHPGLSDEADSTFRYHIVIAFAYYLLNRLASRKK